MFSLTKFLSWLSEIDLVLKAFYAAMIIYCPLGFVYIIFNPHNTPVEIVSFQSYQKTETSIG